MYIPIHKDEPIIVSIFKLVFLFVYFLAIYLIICLCLKYSGAENLRLVNLRRKRKVYFNSPKPKYTLVNINEC